MDNLSVTNTAEFKHERLDLSRDQLRLLEVVHSKILPVRCRLSTFDHSTCPPYQAISYVWGDDRDQRTILINGETFIVRNNLYCFLELLATSGLIAPSKTGNGACYTRPTQHLWIDQLCIDQNHAIERNHQVQHMHDIFSKAVGVIAWLGEGDQNTDRSMRIISERASVHDFQNLSDLHKGSSQRARNKEYHRGMATVPLFQRDYWKRLWIAQEFILPEDLVLACGGFVLPWKTLRAYYRGMRATSLSIDVFGEAEIFIIFRDGIHSADELVRAPRDADRLDITLIWFSHLNCKDPRDKVYGLLGLVNSEDRIHVDYSKDPTEIFWEALEATKFGLRVCDIQFRRLGWSMGVSGKEPRAEKGRHSYQYQRIFGSTHPEVVFSAQERLKFERQSGSVLRSTIGIDQSAKRLSLIASQTP